MVNRIGTQDATSRVRSAEQAATKAQNSPREFTAFLAEAEAQDVRFSGHALKRIEQRQIEISQDDLSLLAEGIGRAERKGSRESLLLMDRTAYVVNVPSRTVVTAVDSEAMKEKTFTNIDSAIFLQRND